MDLSNARTGVCWIGGTPHQPDQCDLHHSRLSQPLPLQWWQRRPAQVEAREDERPETAA